MKEKNDVLKEVAVELDRFKKKLALAIKEQSEKGNYSSKLEKSLGSTNRQFTIWHDGGEWLISLKGKEQEQCKKLREWICGNYR